MSATLIMRLQNSFNLGLTGQGKYDTHVIVSRTHTTAEAAKAVGITRITLQRWIASGKIKAPRPSLRGSVGLRLWTDTDVARLQRAKEEIYRKGRGRKPKPKR